MEERESEAASTKLQERRIQDSRVGAGLGVRRNGEGRR